MRPAIKKRATILLCSVAMIAATSAADARPGHKAHRQAQYRNAITQVPTTPDFSDSTIGSASRRYVTTSERQAVAAPARRGGRRVSARQRAVANSGFASTSGSFTSNSLVSEARKYLGTNPTGRSTLWCGAFMDLVLRRTGYKGGGNLARAYAKYGTRVSGPQVGAIAVMSRGRGGGHVGVVSGVDANGNPIIISGNHNRTTAESVYPAGRVLAYVVPN